MAEKKGKEILEVPEKIQQDPLTYNEALKYMVEQKKAEFQAIQGKIMQYKTQISSLEQRLISLEGDHNAKLLAEKQKFENYSQQKNAELNNRESVVRQSEEDYLSRKVALEERETKVEQINEERRKLVDERLKYEQLNNQAQLKFNEANNLFGEAVTKSDNASKDKQEAVNKLNEVRNTLSIIERSKDELKEKEIDVQKQTDNLISLRKEISPQIEELNRLNDENESKIKDIVLREQAINDRMAEDNKLLSILDEKGRNLQKKEIELSSKEQELLRKEIVIKNL